MGRSHAFWQHFYPSAQQFFPESLGQTSLDEFHFAINGVEPTMIRVEADEVTYNLHIMLRFDLERDLISGKLDSQDVPTAWNDRFEADFGIRPQTDADGCLQDVHWSAGLFGYFPTYSLGNMHAAQMFESASQTLGDLDAQFAAGEFGPLKSWLNTNVHEHGKRFAADQLIEVITGKPLSDSALVRQLNSRFRSLYVV